MDGFLSRRSAPITLLALLAVHSARASGGLHLLETPCRKAETGCYDKLGCFPTDSDSHYPRIPGGCDALPPQSPEEIGTTLFLQTPENMEQDEVLDPFNHSSIKNSHFSTNRRTYMVIHGFTETGLGGWVYNMCKEHIDPSYGPRNYHLIGQSLGAQVAAEAGKRLNPRVCRIVGLDPARPLFENTHHDVYLDHTDAFFVVVVHTDSALIGLGFTVPTGHHDHYPNGGKNMPGCLNLNPSNLPASIDLNNLRSIPSCSHNRARKYFHETIQNCSGFLAFPCDSYESFLSGSCFPCKDSKCTYMGFCDTVPCDYTSNVIIEHQAFYLKTGREVSHFPSWMYKVSLFTQTSESSVEFLFSATIKIDNHTVNFSSSSLNASYSTFIYVGSEIKNISRVTFTWSALYNGTQVGAKNVNVQSGDGQTTKFCSDKTVEKGMTQNLSEC